MSDLLTSAELGSAGDPAPGREKPTLFVSDVHLNAARPAATRHFLRFLAGPASAAQRLYLLGDCFDRYLGDDDQTAPHPEVSRALSALRTSGVPIGFVHGNHDFLVGSAFARRTGCELLPEQRVIEVNGVRALIMHGDTLCTDDAAYQAFRAYSREPANQREFLAKPLAERVAEAEQIRVQSRQATRLKPTDIMDVNESAAAGAMDLHEVSVLIHGHTHRPAIHRLERSGRRVYRVVLGDWYEQESIVVWDRAGIHLGTVAELL